jgi:hypothetical protein
MLILMHGKVVDLSSVDISDLSHLWTVMCLPSFPSLNSFYYIRSNGFTRLAKNDGRQVKQCGKANELSKKHNDFSMTSARFNHNESLD